MIRVKIAGEEVLSNKDFTITEELLKTSSTILDNVYPKEWETTHDYVNNFYFPKDYSSCTIENVEPITPIIGTRVSGNNINLNYNNELSFEIEQLKGNTTQNGTPTPSSPIPVNNVTGRQDVTICSKNLFDKDNANVLNAYMYYNSGRIVSDNTGRTVWIRIKPNTTYTVSKVATARFMIGTFSQQPANNVTPTNYRGNNTATSITITSGANDTYLSAWVYNSSYDTLTPEQVYATLQIEEGNQATTYEPYIGKQYEINLGKNLFDKNNANVLNAFVRNNAIVLDNATRIVYIPCNPNYTYTVQKENNGTKNRFYIFTTNEIPAENVSILNGVGTQTGEDNTSNYAITTNSNAKYLCIFCYISGETLTFDDILNSIQIEEGSQATSYSPYKTPIELCKIGDYQDYLFKINNKWYLHKEVGKVDDFTNINIGVAGVSQGFFMTLDVPLNVNNLPIYSNTQTNRNSYDGTWKNYGGEYIGRLYSSVTNVYINKQVSSVSDAKTWLSNIGTIIYYPLATPTDTEITDTELINQIKSIELYNGINNISTLSPNANGELQIYYNYRDAGEDIDLIFAGLVKNSGSISLRPTDPKYCSLQILDYKTLLSEGQTLDYVINNKTIKEAIQMVINSVTSYGFIEGNIEIDAANDVIGAYSTLNKTPYDIFQYLADISQSKWFTRVIDEKTIAIDFYDPDKLPKANDIEYTEEYFKDNNIIDINFSFSGSDYRNKQTILSEKVYGNIAVNDIITCNGYEQTFTTSQTIGTVNSIKVNNIEKTFVTNTEKNLGILADFYYSPNSNSFESEELYNGGDKIIISYMPIVKGRRVITNDNEISRITQQINRNGTISRYEERNDIVDGDELSKVAEAYIKYKGTAEIKLNVLTQNKDLFNIGQQVYFDMPNVEGLSTDYMVKKKNIEIIQTGDYKNVFYTYELTSNFNSETDINFFDNQRRKAEGNISEDQFITRNVDINNTANIIFDNLQIEQVQTTDNNTLNCTLNSPFIN